MFLAYCVIPALGGNCTRNPFGSKLFSDNGTNMTPSMLREAILNALAGSSSQMPINLAKLQALLSGQMQGNLTKLQARTVLAELPGMLDSMCQSRELQCCQGIKDGKAYTTYWLSGMMPPAWRAPRRDAASAPKTATEQAQKTKDRQETSV